MYDVGQVVFVISDKHKRVLPVRVVEQVVRRTLDGESIEYRVQGDNGKQTYALSQIGTHHFSSAADVKKYMYDNATLTIDEIVGAALRVAESKYSYQESINGLPVSPPPISEDASLFVESQSAPGQESSDERATIKLPDGTYARVNVDIPGL